MANANDIKFHNWALLFANKSYRSLLCNTSDYSSFLRVNRKQITDTAAHIHCGLPDYSFNFLI